MGDEGVYGAGVGGYALWAAAGTGEDFPGLGDGEAAFAAGSTGGDDVVVFAFGGVGDASFVGCCDAVGGADVGFVAQQFHLCRGGQVE